MLNTLVKPNDIIKHEPWKVIVFLLSQGTVSKKTGASAIHDHMLFCKTVVSPENLSIIAKSLFNFKLEIQESILLKSILNKNISSISLYFF